MKSLEEIKKGLECCFPGEDPDCFECPYRAMENCFDARINDVIAYIQRLERERDAYMAKDSNGAAGGVK